jgi:hypothetical protein
MTRSSGKTMRSRSKTKGTTTMTNTGNPIPDQQYRRVSTYLYAYGDNLVEVVEDLAAKAREFFSTLDGVELGDEIHVYDVKGNGSEEWQRRATGAKYTAVTVTGPGPAFPPGPDRPAGDRAFLFTEDDLRYALDEVHGHGYHPKDGEAGATGTAASFWYPRFETALRRHRAMKLVAPEATDRP